jgi:signal transduction histidine kinase
MGYPPEVVEQWRCYPVTAAGPAPEAVRTGQSIFVESVEEFKARYGRLPSQTRPDFRAWAAAPLMVKDRTLGVIGLSFTDPQVFTPQDRNFLLALAQQCAQALERARLYEVEQQARAEAEANQQRLALLAEMRERNRLAQELHDTVAQTLGYLNLKIGIAENLLADEKIEAAQANLRELKQVIGETYTDVREEIFNLRAKILSGLSFTELLNRYIDKYRRFYNLDIQLIQEVDLAVFDFPPQTTSQLVRIVQEALINIRKHAQVNQAVIRLGEENGQIRISIEDKGRGFDPATIKEKTASFGLQIMRERVESVGGTLEINTVPGQGTQVILRYQK